MMKNLLNVTLYLLVGGTSGHPQGNPLDNHGVDPFDIHWEMFPTTAEGILQTTAGPPSNHGENFRTTVEESSERPCAKSSDNQGGALWTTIGRIA